VSRCGCIFREGSYKARVNAHGYSGLASARTIMTAVLMRSRKTTSKTLSGHRCRRSRNRGAYDHRGTDGEPLVKYIDLTPDKM
jgi:hypothetical protein